MNCIERAQAYVKSEKKRVNSERYFEIDTLIKPLCELMNNNGYITLWSCSGHIKIGMYKKYRPSWDNIPLDYKVPYIMFVAPVTIKPIQAAIHEMQQLGYNVTLSRSTDHPARLTRVWSFHVRGSLDHKANDETLYKINQVMYDVFKKHLS